MTGTLVATAVSAGTFEGPGWDHSSINGLADDDHAQYLLADGTRDLTGTLTVSAGSGYAFDILQSEDGQGGGIQMTNVTDPTRQGYVFMDSNGYLELSTDIGNIEFSPAGGGGITRSIGSMIIDDNYYLAFGYHRDYSFIYDHDSDTFQLVDGFTADTNVRMSLDSAGDITIYEDLLPDTANTGSIGTSALPFSNVYADSFVGVGFDHSELIGLDDDDHPIYLPSDGSRAMTGTLTINTTGGYMRFSGLTADIGLASDIDMINLSSLGVTIDNNLTVTGSLSADHDTLLGLLDDDHTIYLNTTRHDTTDRHGAASVDHGLIDGLGDDDHSQYSLADGTRIFTGSITVSADQIILVDTQTPGTSGAAGEQGTIAWDTNYIYICIQDNIWKRAELLSW
jgi:hypothetical protein